MIAPESDEQRIAFESAKADIMFIDGRIRHTNGWFVVRSLIPEGATTEAIKWTIKANAIPGWKSKPAVHVSQVGYHPRQSKMAIVELDASDKSEKKARSLRITDKGGRKLVKSLSGSRWGSFLRYIYLRFDFSDVQEEGIYMVEYGNIQSNPFSISPDIYRRHVWQPTLEYFLPVQMCHMRVIETYKVWHGICHMDDALMAPVDSNHFDGYRQGPLL